MLYLVDLVRSWGGPSGYLGGGSGYLGGGSGALGGYLGGSLVDLV